MTGEEVSNAMLSRRYDTIVERIRKEGNTDATGEKKRQEIGARSLAMAELRLGNHGVAQALFGELLAMDESPVSKDYCERGAAYWIDTKTTVAIQDWREALGCSYGDSAGNLTPALLLFYAAVNKADKELKQGIIEVINKKLRSGWARNWPAPLGRYLIGSEGEDHVEEAIAKQHPLRQPDERCRFDFYRGVKQLDLGHAESAQRFYRAALDHPDQKTWTTEFVLASHELGEI